MSECLNLSSDPFSSFLGNARKRGKAGIADQAVGSGLLPGSRNAHLVTMALMLFRMLIVIFRYIS